MAVPPVFFIIAFPEAKNNTFFSPADLSSGRTAGFLR